MVRILVVLISCIEVSGCYYTQAVSGQWEVLRKRVPVDEVIADPETSPELGSKLKLMSEARDFSIEVLHLPDTKSYRSYSDLDRDYVVWNVLAAPEFSLEPNKWCFPVAGCVSYRGYFSKDKAVKKSRQLAEDGFDVAVGGVAAYSTLGNFNDPILSTMMHWDDIDLVAVLFHELAHQVVYVKDDSAFNESFATAVEEFGVRRWLDSRQDGSVYSAYLADRDYGQQVTMVIQLARNDLQQVYASDVSDFDMREQKKTRLKDLASELEVMAKDEGHALSAWFGQELNNAHLISTILYEGLLPQFRLLYRECNEDIDCFYSAAGRLAALDKDERDRVLSTSDLGRFSRGADDQ
jgi:predicted aminopeptidase